MSLTRILGMIYKSAFQCVTNKIWEKIVFIIATNTSVSGNELGKRCTRHLCGRS